MAKLWKKGRGKLGPFAPLVGDWVAEAESPMGPVRCERSFERVLDGQFLRLRVHWRFLAKSGETSKEYEELAVIGPRADGQVGFWSFTSDGKSAEGVIAVVTDLHPEAVGFEADMPAGHARMAYWPASDGGFHWVVESRTKKGWNRFVEHVYQRA